MYYKLGKACVTNWGSFIITNWGKCCYKLEQLLQTRATVITKQGSYYKLEHNISAVLMKHRGKVKGEEVIILQMDQQLKTKNISDVSGQLLETD